MKSFLHFTQAQRGLLPKAPSNFVRQAALVSNSRLEVIKIGFKGLQLRALCSAAGVARFLLSGRLLDPGYSRLCSSCQPSMRSIASVIFVKPLRDGRIALRSATESISPGFNDSSRLDI